MYLLYLDDAGSVKNQNEEYFVLGGVCTHESRLYTLTKKLDELAEKHDPDHPTELEFHASEILRGKTPPWNNLKNYHEREQATKGVLTVLAEQGNQTVIFACAVHKKSFLNEDIALMAFEDMCSRFNLFLGRLYAQKKQSEKGQIILDKSSDENQIQRLAIEFRYQGNRWGKKVSDIPEVPMFADSKASRLIQLADHVAHAVFKRYERESLNLFNVIQHKFDSDGNTIHGLAHKHTIGKCLCPSCLSRK